MLFGRYRDLAHFWRSNLGQMIAFYMWQNNIRAVHRVLPTWSDPGVNIWVINNRKNMWFRCITFS